MKAERAYRSTSQPDDEAMVRDLYKELTSPALAEVNFVDCGEW